MKTTPSYLWKNDCAEAAIVILKDLFNYIENSHLPIKSYEILPALPDLLNQETLDLTRHYYKTQYLKDFEKDKRKAKEEGITRDYSDPEPREFIFQMISWFMDKDFTASLLKHCKNHEVTVHTALGVSLLRAFYKVIGPEDQSERILQFPISARKFMKESIEDKLGCYITIEMIPLDCSWERNFWEICKELKESIQKVLNTGRIFSSAYFMRDYLVDDKSYFEQLKELPPRKHRGEYEFSLSNIGKQNFKSNYGDIKVRGLFAPTFSAVGEKVIGVNSCNGEMNFTLVFDDQTFTKEQGLKIKEWTILFLKQAMEFRN
jgi:hypothetical protein